MLYQILPPDQNSCHYKTYVPGVYLASTRKQLAIKSREAVQNETGIFNSV